MQEVLAALVVLFSYEFHPNLKEITRTIGPLKYYEIPL